jgi:hypothetical protein
MNQRRIEISMHTTSTRMLTLIKFSTKDCPACQHMAGFDATVASEMGADFIDVDMRDPASYRPYRPILLGQHPLKHELGLPAYLLVEDINKECVVRAEIEGAMPRERFQAELKALIETAKHPTTQTSGSG